MPDKVSEAVASDEKSRPMPMLNFDLSKITAASRVYIVEHFVVHLSLALLTISGIALFNSVIDNFMDSPAQTNVFARGMAVEQLVAYLAMAIVGLPVFALFYTRTRKAERAHPQILLSRARRRLIYATLALAALFMLGYSIAFVYSAALTLINSAANVDGESWLQTALKQLFGLGYIGLISYFLSRMTQGITEEAKSDEV